MKIENCFHPSILENKNIVIAGGSSGIGLDIARAASKLGASLTLIARNEKRLKNAVASLDKSQNQNHSYFSCDLSSFKNSNELFNQFRSEFYNINGIVWSAGSELIKSTRIISEEDVKTTFGASNFGFLGAVKSFSSKGFGRIIKAAW